MGKIVNNKIVSSLSGRYGDDIVFRQVGDRTFFARKGVISKPPSAAQRGSRELFAAAQNYASEMLAQPEFSEWYSIMAKINGLRTAQIAAVKDYMSRPEIDSVDIKGYKGNAGDVIYINPKMLLKVERAEVTIYAGDSILESGPAVKNELSWKYCATADNTKLQESRIVVVAYDRIGKSYTYMQALQAW